ARAERRPVRGADEDEEKSVDGSGSPGASYQASSPYLAFIATSCHIPRRVSEVAGIFPPGYPPSALRSSRSQALSKRQGHTKNFHWFCPATLGQALVGDRASWSHRRPHNGASAPISSQAWTQGGQRLQDKRASLPGWQAVRQRCRC